MRKCGFPRRVKIMARKKKVETTENVSEEQVAETVPVANSAEPVMTENQPKTEKKTVKTKSRSKKTEKKAPATSEKTVENAVEKTVEKTAGTDTEMPVEPIKEEIKKPAPKKNSKKSKKVEPIQEKKEAEQPVEKEVKTEEIVKTETVKKAENKEIKKEMQPQKKAPTRAEKNEAIQTIIKELLAVRAYKWSELLDESGKLYSERLGEEETKNANDLRGRIGSAVDVMKKEGEVVFDGGMYALKTLSIPFADVDKQEKSVEVKETDKELSEEKETQKEQSKPQEQNAEKKNLPAVKPEAKVAPVFDMSVLFTATEQKKDEGKTQEKKEETPLLKAEQKPTQKPIEKTAEKPTLKVEKAESEQPKKTEQKPSVKKPIKEIRREVKVETKRAQKTADEKLKEAFLRKIRSLGGKYFEYYTVYLLERYSMRNGRRIEGLRISGNERDGGIDGELEVSDRLGFRETIYVQSKNWNPTFGKEESWVVGETLVQQFIGAVAYRQAREGKQHCRGIFMTASYFTAGAKEMLEQMSDKFVGYDGDELYEAAKECGFGIIKNEKGEYVLDEKLLSGDKAFFALY